ncbi:MAG: malonic semialdehyde reductase [Rickettsiaceae bacterium]|nr:malonic semialdehyde reductase [Rickettsiaceae bacterium]
MVSKSIEEIFLNERTCYNFADVPVSDDLLKEIYDIMKMGPTSANGCPLRIAFVKTPESKEKLISCAMEGNVANIKAAPVTAIFAYDMKFYDKLPELFPHNPGIKGYFSSSESVVIENALRNSSLQAAYFMIVARAKGLSCSPMGGFDSAKLNQTFFPDGNYRVNFICNLGYRSKEEIHPRLPRLSFEDCCRFV